MKAFSLTELLIGIVLAGLVILAATSADITARRFFLTASKQAKVQDELKIAMEHIVKSAQMGIGDMTNLRNIGDNPFDAAGCSRGYYILNDAGLLSRQARRLWIKMDYNRDGRFTDLSEDRAVEYNYDANSCRITYTIQPPGAPEPITDALITGCEFSMGSSLNEIVVTIRARAIASGPSSLDNPETTLTSSVVLRAMPASQ